MHLKSIVLILLTSVVAAENGICYLKDLQNAENIAPVTPNITLSGDHLNVTCEEGYTTRTGIPLCIGGKWNRDSISPCKEMTCKPPPKVANAVEEIISRHRAVVIYRCKEPYILEGPSEVECRFGEWRGQLPICTDKNCTDAPPNVIHATVEIISTPQNKLAKYVCKEPYLLVGNSEIRCLLGRWNGTAPMCTDSRCYINDLPTEENLAEGAPIATNSGEKLNATCKVGYTLHEERPVCQNGTWIKNSFPICKESTCSIPNIDHGEVLEEYKGEYYFNLTKLENDRNIMHIKMPIGRVVSPGTSYTLLCLKGHVVQGKSVNKSDISCNAGIWLPEPVCVFEKKCRKLNETNLLSIYYTDDRKIGSFAFFQCSGPRKGIDEPFARCLGNALWSKSEPTCESKCEEEPPPIQNGRIEFFDRVRSEVRYRCDENFEILRNSSVICNRGKWEGDPLQCQESKCEEEPPAIQNGRIESFDGVHGSEVRYRCDENFEILKESSVICNRGQWEGDPPQCQENREKHSSTTESPSSSSPSVTADTCYCTYDYPTDILAYSGNRTIDAKSAIWKGETVSLSCQYGGMDIVWNNGLAFYGAAVTLTCNTCKNWSRNDLPGCRVRQPADSFLIFSNDMKILPGGIIEIPRHTNVSFECINLHQGPAWNPNDISGTYVSELRYDVHYRISLQITDARDLHAQKYACFAWIGRQIFRSTTLDLKIADFEIQCPLLEKNTNRGIFNIQYENNRKVHSEAKYACQSRAQKLLGTNSRECMPNGQWSGSYPSCEGIQACILKEARSDLLVEPLKDYYRVGESITLSCPPGQKLSSNVERVMCLRTSWSDSIPDCVKVISVNQ